MKRPVPIYREDRAAALHVLAAAMRADGVDLRTIRRRTGLHMTAAPAAPVVEVRENDMARRARLTLNWGRR